MTPWWGWALVAVVALIVGRWAFIRFADWLAKHWETG